MSDTTWTVHRRPYVLGQRPISHYRRDLTPTEYVEIRKTSPGYTWQLRTIREHDVFSRPRVLQEGYATTLRQAKADAPTTAPPRHTPRSTYTGESYDALLLPPEVAATLYPRKDAPGV